MPLLNKRPFVKKPFFDYGNSKRLFFCDMTEEVFDDYGEFCRRIIMCNSLVWSCCMTGKPGLTFQEAEKSEKNARNLLNDFPVELRVPIVYLASLTRRTSLIDMTEDVYMYARDHYFVGEMVEVNFRNDTWSEGHILQVLPPSDGNHCLEKDEDKSCLPAHMYQYEAEQLDDEDMSELMIVEANRVRRKKGCYSREKNRLFLRQLVEQDQNGIWVVKDQILQQFGVTKLKFSSIFTGSPPSFEVSRKIKTQLAGKKLNNIHKKDKIQGSIDRFLNSPPNNKFTKSPPKHMSNSQPVSPLSKRHSLDKTPQKEMARKLKDKYKDIGRKGGVTKKLLENHKLKMGRPFKNGRPRLSSEMKERLKEQALEEKQKRSEERMKERTKRREEKEKLAKFMKEWNRKREDLECEDLKELPAPHPIQCGIPNEYFGEFVMILEFFNSFADTLPLKNFFPSGVTFGVLERALCSEEVAGPLNDIIQCLLTALFNMQEEENEEIQSTDKTTAADLDIGDSGDVTMVEATRAATAAASWPQLYQGVPLSKLMMDATTLTEVLRLHLLASGGRCSELSAKWRYQQRGGYINQDDPALQLRVQQPHILRALGSVSVCELPLPDKLSLLSCLTNQMLTYSTVRDVIDECADKLKQGRVELRAAQIAELKRGREVASNRLKERREAKLQPPVEGEAQIDHESKRAEDEREELRVRQELQRKASALLQAASKHQHTALGSDRAYRRFWMFSSLPGLFVEADERWPGACLQQPTPPATSCALENDTLTYVRQLFEGDKENDRPSNAAAPGDKALWPNIKSSDGGEDLRCTAGPSCLIHSNVKQRTKWAFYSTEEEVDTLIECLNKRGIREGELRQVLVREQENILKSLKKCPIHKLEGAQEAPDHRKSTRNSQTNGGINVNYPPGTPVDEILELTLRDFILEMEEKIHLGCLGSLKVTKRGAWRTAINDRGYDKQCETLSWGRKAGTESASLDNIPVEKIKTEERDSRPDTPSSETSDKDPSRLLNSSLAATQQESPSQRPVIRNLASAILQLAQGLENKYLQKPLGSGAAMGRWETSLMCCTSFSQLFLHLSTLESSIQWSKSALNAHCRLCRRRGDPQNMLLCDGCNKGHHLYCLKPRLARVPQGDWFCPSCRPEEKKPRSTKRSRRLFSQESEDEESDAPEAEEGLTCESCGESGRLAECDLCSLVLHPKCMDPPQRKFPKGKWICSKCKGDSSRDAVNDGTTSPPLRQRRCCAAIAVANISKFAKRLRSQSWDDEGSVNGDEVQPSRRSARHNHEVDPDLPLDNAMLQDLLTELMHHKDGWPFLRPVQKAQVPDYHLIIKRPMDFGKMKYKLNMLEYRNNSEFIADAMLVFENCQMYNQVDAEEFKAGVRLSKFFAKRCKELGLQFKEDELRSPIAKKSRLG